MKYTFEESMQKSATEFYLLRQSAENKEAFDKAVEWMSKKKFIADIENGTVRNKDGFVSQFTNYVWSKDYFDNPHFIFYDFFRPNLMNKYSRIIRGVDNA